MIDIALFKLMRLKICVYCWSMVNIRLNLQGQNML